MIVLGNFIQRISAQKVDLLQILMSVVLIAVCAQIRIPLPFTPVPLTLQTAALMLVGGMIGSRKAFISTSLYLLGALFGLPILSGGQANPLFLMSPLGGYLIGFAIQAFLAGWFVERQQQWGKKIVPIGLTLSCIVQLACGVIWLSFFVEGNLLELGVLPFIPGELLKVMAVTALLAYDERK